MQQEKLHPNANNGPRTGYVLDFRMINHKPIVGSEDLDHPESPYRIACIHEKLKAEGLLRRCQKIEAIEAPAEQIIRVHTREHHDLISSTAEMREKDLIKLMTLWDSESVYICGETAFCARLAAGGAMELCRSVHEKVIDNGLAIIRPPGHHAEHEKAMGFCIYNNVAIAAKYLQDVMGLKKILILDWDVHHGNGIQHVFDEDPSVLYISLHRYENGMFYPGLTTASHEHVGSGPGRGFNVNVAWSAAGMGDPEFLYAFQHVIIPIAYEFNPEFVIVAAGFDAAEGDPIGECEVTPGGYATMTHQLKGLANGNIVLSLEGGYNLEAISASVASCVHVLLGDPPELPNLDRPIRSEGVRAVRQTIGALTPYWKSLSPPNYKPPAQGNSMIEETSYSIAEMFRSYRSKMFFEEFEMIIFPITKYPRMDASFPYDIFCTHNAFDCKVLSFVIHDIGPIRLECDKHQNPDLMKSFVVEPIYPFIRKSVENGVGLVVISVYPSDNADIRSQRKNLLEYLWDEYVTESNAEKINFVCVGAACEETAELLSGKHVEDRVQKIVMIPGPGEDIPWVSECKAQWYFDNSYVIAPCHERWQNLDFRQLEQKRFGKVFPEAERDRSALEHLRSFHNQIFAYLYPSQARV